MCKLKFAILLSCMTEDCTELIHKSNIQEVHTIFIKQDKRISTCHISDKHTVYEFNERGLSLSRNRAIQYAKNFDICLISDNDQLFIDGIDHVISNSYAKYPDADLIIFNIEGEENKLGTKCRFLNFMDLMKIRSSQISFRENSIIKNNIFFDVKLGAGSGNGGGEENKFLLDCFRSNLKILYIPLTIAKFRNNKSTWFNGYNAEYFINRGKSTRYIYGIIISIIYAIYFVITKHDLYKDKISSSRALAFIFIGIIKGIS